MVLIAISPHVFPMMSVFAQMGRVHLKLNSHTLSTAPIIIAIAVHDSDRFRTHYRLALIKALSSEESRSSPRIDLGIEIFFTAQILISRFFCIIPRKHERVYHYDI
jgi:hypothetical protein